MSFRTKFDLVYTIMNDEETGLLTYIGDKSTIISYDGNLNQWNMTVPMDSFTALVLSSDVDTQWL